jgi:hypothetical protein
MSRPGGQAIDGRDVTKKRKVGRPRKKPGEPVDHRLTPRIAAAITAMIGDGLTVEEAAKVAELTPSAIYKAMRHQPAREFYTSELRQLLHCTKHLAAHALIKELKGDNAAARVAAARTLLAEDDRKAPVQGMPQMPGFSFLVIDAPKRGPILPNVHAAPMIAGRAIEAEANPTDR